MLSRILCYTLISMSALSAQTRFVAHRGASYDAAENTVASANLAWQQNADAVEIDVYRTPDGRVMVLHDRSTLRTAGEDLPMEDTPSATLRTLDVGTWKSPEHTAEKIPFIEEIIATIPDGKTLVIELKSTGLQMVDALKPILAQVGPEKSFAIIAFDFDTIVAAKKTFPHIPCYWLASKAKDLPPKIKAAAEAKLDGIDLKNTIITQAIADQAKALNLELWTWTVDDVAEAQRLQALGVKTITTNRPGWLRAELAQKEASQAK